uniref:Uncharacterized protein n=1 Tax=Rhizophora mucronata TaxID=61149 RepID=A0A2P2N0S4_RHIMU
MFQTLLVSYIYL